MAIDDNTKYGLTGAQVKDLAARIKAVGGIKALTTDDYDYPTSDPDGIALWTLDEGLYLTGEGAPGTAFKLYTKTTSSLLKSTKVILLVVDIDSNTKAAWFIGGNPAGGGLSGRLEGVWGYRIGTNGTASIVSTSLLTDGNISDSLAVTYGGYTLDARQGKVLKDLIDSLIVKGTGAPTTSTVGTVGKLYEDTTNGELYQCTNVASGVYTWEKVGGGGGGTVEPYNIGAGFINAVVMEIGGTLEGEDFTDALGGAEGVAAFKKAVEDGRPIVLDVEDEGMMINLNVLSYIQDTEVSLALGNVASIGAKNIIVNLADENIRNANLLPIIDEDYYATECCLVPKPSSGDTNKFLKGDGTWQALSAPTVVQTTGTSTTDVMSQKAVTDTILNGTDVKIGENTSSSGSTSPFDAGVCIGNGALATYTSVSIGRNAAARNGSQVAIGNSAQCPGSGSYGVAVGRQAEASGGYCVAIGAYSSTNNFVQGEFSIGGSGLGTNGYNGTSYRLLTNVHDPVSSQDAATKNYVDTTVGNIETILQTLNNGGGAI